MPRTAEELIVALSRRDCPCPVCDERRWGTPETVTELTAQGEVADRVPLLRAVCLSCGFLAWFQVGVPEDVPT